MKPFTDIPDSYKKQNPFITPDGYLDALLPAIQDKISCQREAVKKSSPALRVIYLSGIAALFAVALLIFKFPNTKDVSPAAAPDHFVDQAIEYLIDEEIEYLTIIDIYPNYDED